MATTKSVRPAFELPSEEEIERLFRPVVLPEPSGEWIGAREARLLISREARVTLDQAESAICRRALHWVPVKVATFGRREDPHDYIDRYEYFKDREIDLSHFTGRPTPHAYSEVRDFFEAIGCHEPILSSGDGVSLVCWATGDFAATLERDFSMVTLEVTGTSFDRTALLRSIGAEFEVQSSVRLPQETLVANRSTGGRPASSHGSAIASLTLRLASLDPTDLRRYTSASTAAELAEEYRKQGEAPPSEPNLEKYAGGILRILRARET